LVVGIADVVPKLIVKKLLDPARAPALKTRMVCREGKTERLLTELAAHDLDVVISDSPLPAGSSVRAFNHLLGECGMSVFGRKDLAARYRKKFPKSLDGAPMLLPNEATTQRRALDVWFDEHGVRPKIEAEFDDSALLGVFGQDGAGLFAAPSAIESFIKKHYEVDLVGRLPEVRERFYAISIERRIRHPAVVAICHAAREELFKET
jgi:LysR family transcriptional activator of nhaA